jgi:ribonuclease P protein component
MISRKNSLSNSRAISYIFKRGKPLNLKFFKVFISENKYDNFRLAISISKKNFKKAVTRNSIKRKIKHIVHLLEIDKCSCNIIIIPQKGVENITFAEMILCFDLLKVFFARKENS